MNIRQSHTFLGFVLPQARSLRRPSTPSCLFIGRKIVKGGSKYVDFGCAALVLALVLIGTTLRDLAADVDIPTIPATIDVYPSKWSYYSQEVAGVGCVGQPVNPQDLSRPTSPTWIEHWNDDSNPFVWHKPPMKSSNDSADTAPPPSPTN